MTKDKRVAQRILLAALLLFLTLPELVIAAAEEEKGTPRYRALLIACDQFVTARAMTPIGENNLSIMETVLGRDTRGFEIKRQYGITASKEALAYAINWAFADATEDDVSLLYLSTHGAFDTSHNNPHGELLLSDGAMEDRVSAHELNTMFDKIPGTKVLLVDACNSGALIGKGISPKVGSARVSRTFQSDDYKVLTSSGASEPSWYMIPTLDHAPPGSSYFTTAMAVGAGLIGGYAADTNRDGTITLKEMYDHLWITQASSVAQMFPQDDAFPLFVYDRGSLTEAVHGELTGFVFGSLSLDADAPALKFSYTATAETQVAYRITVLRGGEWDWTNSDTLLDETEFDGAVDEPGTIRPGRKEITLDLLELLPEDWTYAMIHIMTIGDMDEGKQPFIYASRVFSAAQDEDPKLSIRTVVQWRQKNRPELEIFIKHSIPCTMTVTVYDAEGKAVRRLSTSRATRPQGLTPDGSLFYWNGLNSRGEASPPGEYSIAAVARVGSAEYRTESSFVLQ